MEKLTKLIGNIVFGVQVLIAFILLFENSIATPVWLQAFGRLHPLLLHLPIGLLLLTAILIISRKYFESPSFSALTSFLLHLTALTASLSAFMGLLLSMEGGYAEENLSVHKWLGVSLSFFCWFLLIVRDNGKILKPATVVAVFLLVFTGHFGANLTHGENFVLGPFQTEVLKARIITDSTTLFAAAIEPILETKCYSCHNAQKAKGKLVLTSLESIAKGGKNGAIWKPGDAAHSHIIKRLLLPVESKEHMPPKDKAQLTADEIQFITVWIESGANTSHQLKQLEEKDTLKKLASSIISRYQQGQPSSVYHFAFASQEKIGKLSIPNRSVFQIATTEPAIQADFYLRQSFEKKYLDELIEVKEQLVALNLSGMPVVDADLKTIARFDNLEKLNLNNTEVTGSSLNDLRDLKKLRSISLSGTQVNSASAEVLGSFKNLREVYLWNTAVSDKEIESLRNKFTSISWEIGYIPDPDEKSRLSAPLLRNDAQVLNHEELVTLKHNLPGAEIRYSTEGEPDSINGPLYKEPFAIDKYTIVKTRAFKDGWLGSNIAEFVLFKKGVRPSSAQLTTIPDERYPGEGITTLINETKGLPDFYRDPAWMGFRNNSLEAYFVFKKETPTVKSITLSYARNVNAMCMPPETIEVWGGNDKKKLKLLTKVVPEQPKKYESVRIEGVTMTIPPSQFAYYKVVAKPLRKLPDFRQAKKEKGWLMVDEIFFN